MSCRDNLFYLNYYERMRTQPASHHSGSGGIIEDDIRSKCAARLRDAITLYFYFVKNDRKGDLYNYGT